MIKVKIIKEIAHYMVTEKYENIILMFIFHCSLPLNGL